MSRLPTYCEGCGTEGPGNCKCRLPRREAKVLAFPTPPPPKHPMQIEIEAAWQTDHAYIVVAMKAPGVSGLADLIPTGIIVDSETNRGAEAITLKLSPRVEFPPEFFEDRIEAQLSFRGVYRAVVITFDSIYKVLD